MGSAILHISPANSPFFSQTLRISQLLLGSTIGQFWVACRRLTRTMIKPVTISKYLFFRIPHLSDYVPTQCIINITDVSIVLIISFLLHHRVCWERFKILVEQRRIQKVSIYGAYP